MGRSSLQLYPSKWKSDGLERALVLESGVQGLRAWFQDLSLGICVVLEKWLDLSEPTSARMEGGKSGWDSHVGPDYGGSWLLSQGFQDLCSRQEEYCKYLIRVHRKMNPAVAYTMNETIKKVEVGSRLEGFCSSLYERQWLIKWNSPNCVSALPVMSHYHKSPASP